MNIKSFKKTMIAKAKRKGGVYENFGQREIAALKDKYGYNPYPANDGERALKRDIDELNNWCMNYTGRV